MALELGVCAGCGEPLWRGEGQPESCNACLAKTKPSKDSWKVEGNTFTTSGGISMSGNLPKAKK